MCSSEFIGYDCCKYKRLQRIGYALWSHKIAFRAIWSRNGLADSEGVKIVFEELEFALKMLTLEKLSDT